jgi:hypothetical protein
MVEQLQAAKLKPISAPAEPKPKPAAEMSLVEQLQAAKLKPAKPLSMAD